MRGFWWSFVADTSPGLVLAAAGMLAAWISYLLMRRSDRGRARSSIAFLCGMVLGLVVTGISVAILRLFVEANAILAAGLLGSFLSPFLGVARAKWDRPRKNRRGPAMVRNLSS